MVDRLNPMARLPLPSTAIRNQDMGRADFGSFLEANKASDQRRAHAEGNATGDKMSNRSAAPEGGERLEDENSQTSQLMMRMERTGLAIGDPTQDVHAMTDPVRMYTGLDHAPNLDMSELLPVEGSIDPLASAQVFMQWVAPGLDVTLKESLLIEYENPVPAIAAVTAVAAGIGEHTAVLMQLGSQAPDQHEQLIAAPWHLLAGGHLSQLITGGKRFALAIDEHKDSAQSPLPGQASFATARTISSAAIGSLSTQYSDPSTAMHADVRVETLSEEERIVRGTPSRIGQSGAFVAWPLRLLRWLADGKGEITAWLRDYNLSDSTVEAVVHQLRNLSDEQGVRLNRIVLNGRELWRAAEQRQFT